MESRLKAVLRAGARHRRGREVATGMQRETSVARSDADAPPYTPVDLPPDMVEVLLRFINEPGSGRDPCEIVRSMCATHPTWRAYCQSGFMYDAANRALGYYGAHETWAGVQAYYGRLLSSTPIELPGDGSVKAYFEEACNARVNNNMQGVWWLAPFFAARVMQQVSNGDPIAFLAIANVFRQRPEALPNYNDIAALYMQWDAGNLSLVPSNRDDVDYHRLAMRAIGAWNGNRALKYVPIGRADFGELARFAVQESSELALKYVPTGRADYQELATVAVRKNGRALRYVPKDAAYWDELATIAVQNHDGAIAIWFVPREHPEYWEFARMAVQSPQGYDALRHIPYEHELEWVHLAEEAVIKHPAALDWISPDIPMYDTIAEAAVRTHGSAAFRHMKLYVDADSPWRALAKARDEELAAARE